MEARRTGMVKQRGIALVSVLLTVSLIVGLVSSLAYQQAISARRTGQLLHTDQAIMYLFAAEAFAKILLNFDSQQNAYDYYGPDEPWGRGIENAYDGGSLNAAMIELNGRFNLNNLYRVATEEEINSGQQDVNLSSNWRSCYQTILESTVGSAVGNDIETMINSLEDWVDTDVVERNSGAEDSYYSSASSLENSYKTGNNLIADPREIALIRGYASLFAELGDNGDLANTALFRHITALPVTNSKININTATENVLTCLEPESRLTGEIAARIITERESNPFLELDDFYSLLDNEYPVTKETADGSTNKTQKSSIPWKDLVSSSKISVSSNFFKMKTRLIFGLADVTAYSIMQRTPDGGVRIVGRVIDAL